MITTRKILKQYILQDKSGYHQRKSFIQYYLFGDETYAVIRFLRRLRYTEYYFNTSNKRNPFSVIRFAFSFFIYMRMLLHYKLFVPLNVCGPGLYIPHRMGGNY